MKRILWSVLVAAFLWLGAANVAQAQVWVRAPFVRVGVGPGVYVRAPFVNLYVPTRDRYYYSGYGGPGVYAPPYYGPGVIYGAPATDPRIMPPADGFTAPPPALVPSPKTVERPPALPPKGDGPKGDGPALPKSDDPPPLVGAGAVAVEAFLKGFKPRAGSYEIDLINPVTKKPATVRFTLPEGTPTSVEYRGNTVEFRYAPTRFVRIEFDKDGAIVSSR